MKEDFGKWVASQQGDMTEDEYDAIAKTVDYKFVYHAMSLIDGVPVGAISRVADDLNHILEDMPSSAYLYKVYRVGDKIMLRYADPAITT